jgi:hypothetical protein
MNKEHKEMNTTDRDHILFGPTPPTYSGGVAKFTGLALDKIQLLIEKNLLSPTDFYNCSPEVQDFMDFMEDHPEFTAHGYAVSPERKDCRVTIEGIKATLGPNDPPFDPDTIRDFVVRYRHADEFDWEPDRLYCWYD